MENLSSELLEQIFRYLDYKDLLSLTQVCWLFNNVVGGSSKLMDKMTIAIRICRNASHSFLLKVQRVDLRSLVNTNRKYQHLLLGSEGDCHSIQADDIPLMMDLMENIGNYLKSFVFFDLKVKSEFIASILRLTPNLETFHSTAVVYLENGDTNWEVNLPKLKDLNIRLITGFRDHPFNNLFKTITMVERFALSGWLRNIELLRNFFISQKNLKHLDLNDDIYVQLFDSILISAVPFKLESLNMRLGNHFDQFTEFIATQTDLKKLSFSSYCDEDEKFSSVVRLMETVLKLENLVDLHPSLNYGVYGVDFQPDKLCPKMEKIYLSFGKWGESDPEQLEELLGFVNMMPNLKCLHFSMGYETIEIDLLCLNNLMKLETLYFDSYNSSVMKYFELPNLRVIRCVFSCETEDEETKDENWFSFFDIHDKLVNINIYGECFSKLLWIYVEENLRELKTVEFSLPMLNDEKYFELKSFFSSRPKVRGRFIDDTKKIHLYINRN